MYDIFLSYAREDIEKAKRLAAALEKQGWSVFWDRSALLAGQDLDEVIEQAIEQADCMIVAWSIAAKKSHWVRGEADIGRERGILVPIQFETDSLPIAFRALHTENFSAWNGEIESKEFGKLIRAVKRLIDPEKKAGTEQFEAHGTVTTVKSDDTFIEPEMVEIPAGSFQMGSNKDSRGGFAKFLGDTNKYSDEQPMHWVNIVKPFTIAKYPVTFEEYALFVKTNNQDLPEDEGWGRGKRPVINVSWDDAQAYAKWLSDQTGKPYRLPSEAEWEYAARANTTSEYYWGEEENAAEDYAWFVKKSKDKTHLVGKKKPNAFGLYDMSGNVWEWLQDCKQDSYENAPADGSPWLEENGGDCSRRVMRGGSWDNSPWNLRSAYRSWNFPVSRTRLVGFRLALD